MTIALGTGTTNSADCNSTWHTVQITTTHSCWKWLGFKLLLWHCKILKDLFFMVKEKFATEQWLDSCTWVFYWKRILQKGKGVKWSIYRYLHLIFCMKMFFNLSKNPSRESMSNILLHCAITAIATIWMIPPPPPSPMSVFQFDDISQGQHYTWYWSGKLAPLLIYSQLMNWL